MSTSRKLFCVAALACVYGSVQGQFYVPTYSVTNNANESITDIIMYWADPNGGYGSLNTSPAPGFTAAGHATTILQDLPKPRFPQGLTMLGLYTEGAQDALPGQEHVVIMMNNDAANATRHIAWGTVFPTTLESNIISALHTVSQGGQSQAIDDAYGALFGFVIGDLQSIPDGSSSTGKRSAWMTPAPSNVVTPGSIMMFSDGVQIGTVDYSAQAVPEPATLGILGVGLVAMLRKRKATK